MQFVDTIHQTLRQEIRQLNLNQINFEQNRAAVGIAIEKVDIARLRLMQPPAPGETTTFSNTFARDLLQALNDLLQAQNDFMSIWVNYEVQRISLDFDLGIMQLDDRGMWIDPGPVDGAKLMEQYADVCEPEELPFRWQAEDDAERQQKKLREDTTEEEQREEQIPPPDPHTTDSVMNESAPPAGSLFGPPLELPTAERVVVKKPTPREIAAQELVAQQFAANRIMANGKSQRGTGLSAKTIEPNTARTAQGAKGNEQEAPGLEMPSKPTKLISPTTRAAQLRRPAPQLRHVAGEDPVE